MRNAVRALEPRDADLFLGDERPGDGRSQQVEIFVIRIGPQHGKHEVLGEFLFQVFDVHFAGAGFQGFFADVLQFLALTDIGRKRDDFAIVLLLQPLDDDGRVQSAGIGQYNLFQFRIHASIRKKGFLYL